MPNPPFAYPEMALKRVDGGVSGGTSVCACVCVGGSFQCHTVFPSLINLPDQQDLIR